MFPEALCHPHFLSVSALFVLPLNSQALCPRLTTSCTLQYLTVFAAPSCLLSRRTSHTCVRESTPRPLSLRVLTAWPVSLVRARVSAPAHCRVKRPLNRQKPSESRPVWPIPSFPCANANRLPKRQQYYGLDVCFAWIAPRCWCVM